jgi:transposase
VASFGQRFDEIKELNLETSRAWAIKEVFRNFWLCGTAKKAGRYFGQWYSWAIRSRLEPVKKVARMCKRHLTNILTFFEHRHTKCMAARSLSISGRLPLPCQFCW